MVAARGTEAQGISRDGGSVRASLTRTPLSSLGLWQRAGLGYDAKNLSLKLEGFRPGACGHGSCLVAVFLSVG